MSNAITLLAPQSSQTGRNLREVPGITSFIKRAVLWRPRGAFKEVDAATAARVAIQLLCRVSGLAYSADQCRPIPGTPVLGAAAVGTLTGTTIAADDTVTIEGVTYTFIAALTAPAVPGEVLVGVSDSASLDNLISAINGTAGAGTTYGTGTTAQTTCTASAGAGDTLTLTADTVGAGGNAIETTASLTSGDWGAATLENGVTATTAVAGQVMYDSTNIYIALAAVTATSTAGWKKIAHAAL